APVVGGGERHPNGAGTAQPAHEPRRRWDAYRVERPGRGPLWIAWAEGDTFDGEDQPPVELTLPWDSSTAAAIDAFGAPVPVECRVGVIRIAASVTPVFVG
ncbi:hypothetical protein, partial [Dactylosporangium salmoneum]|uniref:hypothetical protein n=1 Tax=Dactylosporangium salmoneum TaxID=53361 RepID=UPI0031DE8D1E